MDEILSNPGAYGWGLVLVAFILLNPDKVAKIFSPIFPPFFRWLDRRRERERDDLLAREQIALNNSDYAFKIIENTLDWMRFSFTELSTRLDDLSIQTKELRGAIERLIIALSDEKARKNK